MLTLKRKSSPSFDIYKVYKVIVYERWFKTLIHVVHPYMYFVHSTVHQKSFYATKDGKHIEVFRFVKGGLTNIFYFNLIRLFLFGYEMCQYLIYFIECLWINSIQIASTCSNKDYLVRKALNWHCSKKIKQISRIQLPCFSLLVIHRLKTNFILRTSNWSYFNIRV